MRGHTAQKHNASGSQGMKSLHSSFNKDTKAKIKDLFLIVVHITSRYAKSHHFSFICPNIIICHFQQALMIHGLKYAKKMLQVHISFGIKKKINNSCWDLPWITK